jgi:hypothetical protein
VGVLPSEREIALVVDVGIGLVYDERVDAMVAAVSRPSVIIVRERPSDKKDRPNDKATDGYASTLGRVRGCGHDKKFSEDMLA